MTPFKWHQCIMVLLLVALFALWYFSFDAETRQAEAEKREQYIAWHRNR